MWLVLFLCLAIWGSMFCIFGFCPGPWVTPDCNRLGGRWAQIEMLCERTHREVQVSRLNWDLWLQWKLPFGWYLDYEPAFIIAVPTRTGSGPYLSLYLIGSDRNQLSGRQLHPYPPWLLSPETTSEDADWLSIILSSLEPEGGRLPNCHWIKGIRPPLYSPSSPVDTCKAKFSCEHWLGRENDTFLSLTYLILHQLSNSSLTVWLEVKI